MACCKSLAHIHKSRLSLRISGDSFLPDETTELLGASPTFCHAKGEEKRSSKTGRLRIARSGIWLLSVDERSPEYVDAQRRELFDQLADDLETWENIYENYSADLFVGLFMPGSNEGLTISSSVMKRIADRRLENWIRRLRR